MIAQHFPALQVVVPLLAAPLCAMLRDRRQAWLWATAVSFVLPVIAGTMLARVLADGPISYHLGNWAPPWGIEYRIDAANGFLLLLVTGIAAVMMPYARASIDREIAPERQPWYYALFLLCLAGLLGMTVTGDAFNVFVFLEISSISTYVLIALGRNKRALMAAYQYLVIGTVGATFFVIGIGFLYVSTGTLNIADLAERLPQVAHQRAIIVGLAFIAVGLAMKLALFPLHYWLPNAYAYAPSAAAAFLAATATKVAIYLLLRFFFTVFAKTLPFQDIAIPGIWIGLSAAAILYASTAAIFQDNVKRLLAFSSVAQIGYITLGVGIGTEKGLAAAIVHLFNHGVMKGALFLLVGGVAYYCGAVTMNRIAGLGRTMPATMGGIVIAGLSMVGVPGTVGFVSKWYLVSAALERGWWWLAAFVVATSVLALICMGRIVEAAYFKPLEPGAEKHGDMPFSMLVPALVLVAACVYFGLDTQLTADVAMRAAHGLLGLKP
ncbi:MAG: monovalent cation/H+ antiporter subunit D family protein [Rhodospirillaceae bacterium]|nr:monovalent cation/H+ antiporter subunit D family protein [Rhodospirillaceae bacterium]